MSRTIDAEDAIKRIRRLWTDDIPPEDRYDRDEYARGLIDAIDAVDDSPTVEREPGEWIEKNSHVYICRECGFEQAIYGNLGEYRYCPHCGARMRGADND